MQTLVCKVGPLMGVAAAKPREDKKWKLEDGRWKLDDGSLDIEINCKLKFAI